MPARRDGKPFRIKPKACRVCGREFTPRNGFQKFCSSDCAREGSRQDCVCEGCGKTFVRYGHRAPRYCSSRCANRATAKTGRMRPKRRPFGFCRTCGKQFRRENPRQDYCSPACRPAARWHVSAKGEDRCRNCRAPATDLHHIVPRSITRLGRDNLANGLPLCHDCHMGWHARSTDLSRALLTAEELATAERLTSAEWVRQHYPGPLDRERHPEAWSRERLEALADATARLDRLTGDRPA